MLCGLLLAGCVTLLGVPAVAADEVASYTAETTVEPDGGLRVDATIEPGPGGPTQITQTFQLSEEIAQLREYEYAVEEVEVISGGEPAGEVTGRSGDELTVTMRARDDEPIHLSYVVRGAAIADEGHLTNVHWNLLQGLSTGVNEFTGTVSAPAQFVNFSCNAGAPGAATGCRSARSMPSMVDVPTITDGPRAAGEVVGFRMLFDPNAVAANENINEQWSVGRAFQISGWPLAAAGITLAVGGLLLYLLHRRGGRDAVTTGEVERIADFKAIGLDESRFVLRQNVRPGQVGTLVDERVDPVDVTASILDLAVRGYLRIRELPREGRFHGGEWEIERRDDAPEDDELLPYEEALLEALATDDGEPLKVSQIASIAGDMPRVQSLLYDEVVEQGWYERRPDATRTTWGLAGAILLVLGVLGTLALAAFTSFGLVGIAVILLALGLSHVATEMPARTAEGARALQGLMLLSADLRTHDTDEMPKDRQYEELSKVLPYAVVLGGRERWLKALVAADDDDDADPTDLDWYHAPEDWHLRDLPDSLRNFVLHVEGELFSR